MRNQWLFRNWWNWFKPVPPKPPVPEPDIPSPEPPVVNPPNDNVSKLLDLHNSVRSRKLSLDNKLNAAAQKHAEWMAKNNRMSHTGSRGSNFMKRIKDEGYNFSTGGENVAYGYKTAQSVFNGWMNSRGHKANILNNNFKEVGFGFMASSNGSIYWCAVFATKMNPSSNQLEGLFIDEKNFPEALVFEDCQQDIC